MLSSVEQEFVWRDEKQAPLKTPACEASDGDERRNFFSFEIFDSGIFFWVGKFWQIFFWVA